MTSIQYNSVQQLNGDGENHKIKRVLSFMVYRNDDIKR